MRKIQSNLAESAKTMVMTHSHGVLSSLSTDGGFPYGSVVNYMPLDGGDVVILLNRNAEHFRYLKANNKASILVAHQLAEQEIVHSARVTLLGEAKPISKSDTLVIAYAAMHPETERILEHEQYLFMQLDVTAVRYIAGFGRAGWLDPVEYRESEPDPLGKDLNTLLFEMNDRNSEDFVLLASALAGVDWTEDVTAVHLDRYGFDLMCIADERKRGLRVALGVEATNPDAFRRAVDAIIQRTRSLRTG